MTTGGDRSRWIRNWAMSMSEKKGTAKTPCWCLAGFPCLLEDFHHHLAITLLSKDAKQVQSLPVGFS